MIAFWKWVGSPGYWAFAAIFTGAYLTIATLGKTGDWVFSGAVALGFYLCFKYSSYSKEAAHGIKENT